MELVTGALGSLIPKLWGLLKEEYKLQKGMEEQIKSLALELESAHAALRKVAEVPPEDEQVKIWARIVREASYDMEDAIDTFLVRVEGREPASPDRLMRLVEKIGGVFSKTKARHQIADMIKIIKKQVDDMAECRRRYNIDDVVSRHAAPPSTVDPRLSAMYIQVRELIGIDKPRGELISLISSKKGDDASDIKKKMLSVVGVGGLGKTTLAKASYDMLKVDFDCGAFVPVGRNPDLKKVLKDILLDLDKEKFMTISTNILDDERLLINELIEFLKNKRYLIIIDDLWDIQSWEIIKLAFTETNLGSRIVVTTRNLYVAKEVGEVYKLQPLSYDNSKKLFYTRIFGGEGNCDNPPDKTSDKFLKKCNGVPLAIITMASLLVDKQREEWSDMYKSIGFGDKDNRHVENTKKILSFSYYDLPSHLRTCLLYLSAFPEDYFIDKDPLIWRWIAEGFVRKKEGKRLFEIGEGYFNDLINRSMIQPLESVDDGRIYGCRVHDMVLDLIRSKSCEENFFTIIDSGEGTASQNTVRRLAYHNRAAKHTHWVSQKDMPHLRSVISCWCEFDKHGVPFFSFKLLRVLDIENFQPTEGFHLEHIGNLLHLRYLGMKQIVGWTFSRRTGGDHPFNDKMSCVLPEEIRALKFLQTLELSGEAFKELPSSIGLLTQLVCLRVGEIETTYEGMLGKLTSLEELMIKPNGTCNSTRQIFRELGCMKELRVLRIRIPDNIDRSVKRDFVESLCGLHNIHHLEVYGFEHFDVSTWEAAGIILPQHLRYLNLYDNYLSRLPSYSFSSVCLPYLSYLRLNVKHMDEMDLKTLSGLPELRYLWLRTLDTVSLNIPASDGFFQKLRFCVMVCSVVQLITNEDSSVSFHLWNGDKGDIPFGSCKKNGQCRVAPTFMPNVEVLEFKVPVRALKDGNGTCDNLGLEHLASLRKVEACLDCTGAYAAEVEEVEASLRHAAEVHPNRPTLRFIRGGKPAYAKKLSPACKQETGDDSKVQSTGDNEVAKSRGAGGGEVPAGARRT